MQICWQRGALWFGKGVLSYWHVFVCGLRCEQAQCSRLPRHVEFPLSHPSAHWLDAKTPPLFVTPGNRIFTLDWRQQLTRLPKKSWTHEPGTVVDSRIAAWLLDPDAAITAWPLSRLAGRWLGAAAESASGAGTRAETGLEKGRKGKAGPRASQGSGLGAAGESACSDAGLVLRLGEVLWAALQVRRSWAHFWLRSGCFVWAAHDPVSIRHDILLAKCCCAEQVIHRQRRS